MRIDHAALFCNDLERCKNFFTSYFNARQNELYHNPRTGLKTYILTFDGGGSRLELMSRPDVTGTIPSQSTVGYAHISLAVGSQEAVDRLTECLRRDGYTVADGPRTTGDGYYESCIIGPEGLRIEITV